MQNTFWRRMLNNMRALEFVNTNLSWIKNHKVIKGQLFIKELAAVWKFLGIVKWEPWLTNKPLWQYANWRWHVTQCQGCMKEPPYTMLRGVLGSPVYSLVCNHCQRHHSLGLINHNSFREHCGRSKELLCAIVAQCAGFRIIKKPSQNVRGIRLEAGGFASFFWLQ